LKNRTSQKCISEELIGENEECVEDTDTWTGEKKLSPETSMLRKEMNDCIRNIIYILPLNYRTIIMLGEREGFTNNEIAEILGVSLDTVKIRLHRAKARLKKELEKHCTLYLDDRNELACDRKVPSLILFKK
jgi:RNA polymerase sigma-70 factor, ECF subfamily